MSDEGEITIAELSKETGLQPDHIRQLVKRKILPAGRKLNNKVMLPAFECRLIISQHNFHADWTPRTRASKKHGAVKLVSEVLGPTRVEDFLTGEVTYEAPPGCLPAVSDEWDALI